MMYCRLSVVCGKYIGILISRVVMLTCASGAVIVFRYHEVVTIRLLHPFHVLLRMDTSIGMAPQPYSFSIWSGSGQQLRVARKRNI